MSTPDIRDDELDDFFRKSLGNTDLDFREEDWLKMEKKLDNHTRVKTNYGRFLYTLLGLLLLVSLSVFTWNWMNNDAYTTNTLVTIRGGLTLPGSEAKHITANKDSVAGKAFANDKNNLPKPGEYSSEQKKTIESAIKINPENERSKYVTEKITAKEKQIDSTPTSIFFEREKASGNNKNNKQKKPSQGKQGVQISELHNTIQVPVESKKADKKDLLTIQQPALHRKTTGVSALTMPLPGKPVIDREENKTIETKRNNESDRKLYKDISPDMPVDILSDSNEPNISTPGSNKEQEIAGQPGFLSEQVNKLPYISIIPGLSARLLDYDTKLAGLLSAEINSKASPFSKVDSIGQQELADKRMHSRLSVNLLISPDLSSIGFTHVTAPGTNVGIAIEYSFSKRISIMAGAVYSTKIYAANASKYNPDNPYWQSYYPKPVEVEGSCKIIDIPLNMRYNLLQKKAYNLYAVAGLSSYLMLREDYKYIYQVYDSNLRQSWHGKNENQHFFKVINISAGYEQKLSRKFSLQAEPYIKLPTAGVGYGRIKLLSTGLFMSLKYKF